MIGETFNSLTVVAFSPAKSTSRKKYYVCRCQCGTEKVLYGPHVTSGNTKSCGCLKTGGSKPRLDPSEAMLNDIISNMRYSAVTRGLTWELERELVKTLVDQPCHYCGVLRAGFRKKRNISIRYNGLDRVDSSRGYEPDNVVPCCGDCNMAKRTRSYDEFIEWTGRIARHYYQRAN
jgi:hypothetical protein